MAVAEGDRVGIEAVVVGTGGGRDLHGDLYRPPASKANGAGVVLVHGGGWRGGDRSQLRGYGLLLGRAGYTCLACEYRLVQESPWPAQIHDVKAAVRWLRAHARELGVDPERIAVEGNSAGAHLALLVAGTAGLEAFEGDGGNLGVPSHVAAVIAVYPPTVFRLRGAKEPGSVPFSALHDSEVLEEALLAGPLHHVRADFPPTMLVHGTADTVVPVGATLRMAEALSDAGVPTDVHIYAEQPHAFDATGDFGRQCASEMLLFLSRYVRETAPA